MNIGLYFGSFNPIHNGHLIIASHILNDTHCKEVWMMVSPQNPLKETKSLLNENHRLHLVQLALEDQLRIKANSTEFNLPRPSYTIDTLTYLSEKYPQHQFSIIIGSDSYLNIKKWKNVDLLLSNYSFLIYQRPNYIVPEKLPENIKIVNAPLLDISSTHIRNLIASGKSISFLVPKNVEDYIMQNNYYGPKRST